MLSLRFVKVASVNDDAEPLRKTLDCFPLACLSVTKIILADNLETYSTHKGRKRRFAGA